MCYFIALTVPASAAERALRQPRDGLHIAPFQNAALQQFAGPAAALLAVTQWGCSCHLYRDPRTASTTDPTETLRRLEAKYRARGWSAAKIERAMRSAGARNPAITGLSPEARTVIAAVAEQFGRIGLHVHFYDGGDTAGQPVSIVSSNAMNPAELRADSTLILPDVFTWLNAEASSPERRPPHP